MIAETMREKFSVAVKEAYKRGYFKIVDANGKYGCYGLSCQTPNNGFYCLPLDAESWEGTADEYVKFLGKENVYKCIADTICDMYQEEMNEQDLGEANLYLLDLKALLDDDQHLSSIVDTILAEYK